MPTFLCLVAFLKSIILQIATSSSMCGHLVTKSLCGILRSECGGTRWRTGGEVKRKLANGVGNQYSHTTSGRSVSSVTNADAPTSAASAVDWTDSPADLNGLVRLGERRKLVSACVPSGSARALFQLQLSVQNKCAWILNLAGLPACRPTC